MEGFSTVANPIPCGKCQQVADADLLVTDRTPDFQLLGVPTSGLCVQCYIEHAMELANALQAAYAAIEAEGQQPGVLEQVEQDEGEVVAADPIPEPPKRARKTEPATVAAGNSTEAQAADVDE
jgi:hypothetical protein